MSASMISQSRGPRSTEERTRSTKSLGTIQRYLGQVSPSFPSSLSRKIIKNSLEMCLALPAGMAWRGGVYPVDLRSRSESCRTWGRHAGGTENELDGQPSVSKRKAVLVTAPRYLLAPGRYKAGKACPGLTPKICPCSFSLLAFSSVSLPLSLNIKVTGTSF